MYRRINKNLYEAIADVVKARRDALRDRLRGRGKPEKKPYYRIDRDPFMRRPIDRDPGISLEKKPYRNPFMRRPIDRDPGISLEKKPSLPVPGAPKTQEELQKDYENRVADSRKYGHRIHHYSPDDVLRKLGRKKPVRDSRDTIKKGTDVLRGLNDRTRQMHKRLDDTIIQQSKDQQAKNLIRGGFGGIMNRAMDQMKKPFRKERISDKELQKMVAAAKARKDASANKTLNKNKGSNLDLTQSRRDGTRYHGKNLIQRPQDIGKMDNVSRMVAGLPTTGRMSPRDILAVTSTITAQGRAAAEKRMSQPPQKTDLQRRMDARHAETMRRVAATKREHEQLEQEKRDRMRASRENAGRRTNNVDRMSVQQGYKDARDRASVMAGQRKAMAPQREKQDRASLEAGKITQRQYDNRQLAYQGRHSEIPEPTQAELDRAREQMDSTPEARARNLAQRQAAARTERLNAKLKKMGIY